MFVHCKVSARLCNVSYSMAPSKYFCSFVGTRGFTLFLFLIFLRLLIGRVVEGNIGCIGNLEVEMQNDVHIGTLAIKTIQSEDGDIIDCVDILRQPSLNHPMLKNHSIQMRPSFYHKELQRNLSSKSWRVEQIWQRSGSCPVGTVPILRDTEEGFSKAFPFPEYGGKGFSVARQEYAAAVSSHYAAYYGAKARLNLWQPYVRPCEYTLNRVTIAKIDYSSYVTAGWGVFPQINGDFRTRLFAGWRNRNGGCYNMICQGFVQTNERITLGATLTPLSVYNGDQYEVEVEIIKDYHQSSWWLSILGQFVGYWPVTIFDDFQTGNRVGWGGVVFNAIQNGIHSNTQMGSGHRPHEGYRKAAYMRDVKVLLTLGQFYVIPNDIVYHSSHPQCYSISSPAYQDAPGASFLYGGAGYASCG